MGRSRGPDGWAIGFSIDYSTYSCHPPRNPCRSEGCTVGTTAYGWAIVTDPVRGRNLLQEGLKEITKVFLVAVVIDLIYEIIVFHSIYVGQSLIVTVAVALLPYVLIRGPINRIVRRWNRARTPAGTLTDLHGRIQDPK